MNRCVIITAQMSDSAEHMEYLFEPDDFVICADGGYELAVAQHIAPSLVVGDFDSMSYRQFDCEVVRRPVEKDETDTLLAVMEGEKRGYHSFDILGGLGGRFDHTYANLQMICRSTLKGDRMRVLDGGNTVTMLMPGTHRIARRLGAKLSVFAYSPEVKGLTLEKLKYPLNGAMLRNDFPLGVSNEFADDTAIISFKEGLLLLVLAKEN